VTLSFVIRIQSAFLDYISYLKQAWRALFVKTDKAAYLL